MRAARPAARTRAPATPRRRSRRPSAPAAATPATGRRSPGAAGANRSPAPSLRHAIDSTTRSMKPGLARRLTARAPRGRRRRARRPRPRMRCSPPRVTTATDVFTRATTSDGRAALHLGEPVGHRAGAAYDVDDVGAGAVGDGAAVLLGQPAELELRAADLLLALHDQRPERQRRGRGDEVAGLARRPGDQPLVLQCGECRGQAPRPRTSSPRPGPPRTPRAAPRDAGRRPPPSHPVRARRACCLPSEAGWAAERGGDVSWRIPAIEERTHRWQVHACSPSRKGPHPHGPLTSPAPSPGSRRSRSPPLR